MVFRQAIRDALDAELGRDERVIFLGEDVAAPGGVFAVTGGLQERHGEERVFDTPISELALVGGGLRQRRVRPAPGGRDHVRRLPAAGHGQPRQPGGQVLLHLQRAGERAARRALRGRRRRALRRHALAEPDQLVPRRARAEDRGAVDAERRLRAPRERHPGRQPRALPRAQAPLCDAGGAAPGRPRHRPRGDRAARHRHHARVRHEDRARLPGGGRAARRGRHRRRGARPAHAAPARPRERSSRRSHAPTGSPSWRRAR